MRNADGVGPHLYQLFHLSFNGTFPGFRAQAALVVVYGYAF